MLWQIITALTGILAIFAVSVSVSEVGKMNRQTSHLLRVETVVMGAISFWAVAKTIFDSWVYDPFNVIHIVYVAVYAITLAATMSHGQPRDNDHVPP